MKNSKDLMHKLANCLTACENCADACLHENNVQEMISCIKTDRDCAEICNTTLRLVARNSNNVKNMLNLCADMCRKCAEECEKHDMMHCKECAAACRECEKACRAA